MPTISLMPYSPSSFPASLARAHHFEFKLQRKRIKMLLSNPFLQSLSLSNLSLTSSAKPPPTPFPHSRLTIRALKPIHGKVICHTNDKTVNVRVIRYAISPKYKKRMRVVKKLQAHDPENKFKVGDLVTLERCRPISKTKHHIAVPYVDPHTPKGGESADGVLNLPLQSAQ
ncbi:hypothetical protein LUZ62_017289 [Rhynchospora pubera]|uniref:30S ribosomal protein S17, chloroplastic n=2 Tax=Rhynchospora pubera TaxID=906938 RepID=A0AAV8GPB0_9POAL|nr:hypothetical protein LUZ62_017289 [Rhynchospora pubera]